MGGNHTTTKNITAKITCEVLMKIFCQTGFPKTICKDQGTNFTAQLTRAFQDVLGVSPMFSTPSHPKTEREILNSGAGSVEEYLKQLQKKLQDTHEIASGNSANIQEPITSHYNLRSRKKSFSLGDEVLIVTPSSTHTLLKRGVISERAKLNFKVMWWVPEPQKVETMSKLRRPTTKKQLRGLIGLASYYHDYVKNISSIVLPLTNLTKKNIPNKIPWDNKKPKNLFNG
ncbi:retrovirus-related Pol polyprotein from transposon opus [Trichonephila clavipes]|nr:retrovirus-related Pol polyprotein from transposon opus [Trichonephila clavipes]